MSDKRPELPDLEVGQKLTLKQNRLRRPDREIMVAKIGHKWAYGCPSETYGQPHGQTEIKFDKKTGILDGGKDRMSPGRVVTDEQAEWEERAKAAEDYLKEELGPTYHLHPRWRMSLVELANLIRRHEGLEEL